MRFAARLLSFILCFELIVGGHSPSIMQSSVAIAADCPKGTSMDATLNRCLTSNQVASIKNAVASCNTGSTEEKQKCYENNATNALNSQVNAGGASSLKDTKLLKKIGAGAAIAVPLFLLSRNLLRKKEDRMVCKPASLILMYAGAGVLLGGEIYSFITHKEKLDERHERWREIATPSSAGSADSKRVQQTEAQSQAFEFMAQNEESLADTAGIKSIYYGAAAGVFASGAAMAVIEMFQVAAANKIIANPESTQPMKDAANAKLDRIKCRVSRGDAQKAAEKEKADKIAEEDTEKKKIAKEEEQEKTKRTVQQEKEVAKLEAEKKDLELDKNIKQKEFETAKETRKSLYNPDGSAIQPSPSEDTIKKINSDFDDKKSAFDLANKKFESVNNDYQKAIKDLASISTPNPIPAILRGNETNKGTDSKSGSDGSWLKAVAPAALTTVGGMVTGKQSDQSNNTQPNNSQVAPPKELTEEEQTDKELCEGEESNGAWKGFKCKCPQDKKYNEESRTCDFSSIQDLRNFKLKRTANFNLENSTNAYELLELEKELENIDFENYSRMTNYDDIDVSKFKQHSFLGLTHKVLNNLNFIAVTSAQTTRPQLESVNQITPKGITPTKTELPKGSDIIFKTVETGAKTTGKWEKFKTSVESIQKEIDKAIALPLTRAGLNTLFGTWIGIMTSDFIEQQEISEKRAEVLRKMKEEFASNEGISSCTEAERNSTKKTDCYCYTAEGKRNSNRVNSTICQKVWGTFSTKPNSYLSDDTKVCLDQNSNVDMSCSCRSQKGPDGKNKCLKASASSFNLSGLSMKSFKMLNTGTSAAQDLANGVLAPGSMNAAAALSNAKRIQKAADDMLKSGDPKSALLVKKLSDSIASKALASTAGLSMGGGNSGADLSNMTPAQAVKSLDEELKKETTQDITSAGSSESVGGGNSAPEQLEFGMTEEDLAIQEDQIAEVMNKDLDMGNTDINKGSDTNLFEVLSNRYQRSGMRRLFDADGKTKAEKPAESDISQ